ncbi:VOC family protein [Mycobacterium sp. pUA109]|uniref:VOC family protein n=1 Tax=Mycobacterium sp. pUA109 TaxID=3238982 RepID=UPI00351B2E61
MSAPLHDAVTSRPIHHIGYVVDDISAAVGRWVTMFGAGPFFWIAKHMSFPDARYDGEPCVLDHSAVIGRWNNNFVELMQLHEVSPAGLRDVFVGSATDTNHINHICYAVEDPDAEVARLEALGVQRFWHATQGPLEVSYCDGRATMGHAIEIHKLGAQFMALSDAVASAAENWDGKDPLRELPH